MRKNAVSLRCLCSVGSRNENCNNGNFNNRPIGQNVLVKTGEIEIVANQNCAFTSARTAVRQRSGNQHTGSQLSHLISTASGRQNGISTQEVSFPTSSVLYTSGRMKNNPQENSIPTTTSYILTIALKRSPSICIEKEPP